MGPSIVNLHCVWKCHRIFTVYLVKCLSKPYLKHFFDCKMFIAATSFNPPGTIFKQGSDKWQKITWIKYWIIPKRNYFQVACSILINILPKVSLIPNFTFSNKCNLIFFHPNSINIIFLFFLVHNFFLLSLQKDQNDTKSPGWGIVL